MGEWWRRHFEAEYGGVEVDEALELGRRRHSEIGGPGDEPALMDARPTLEIDRAHCAAHETARPACVRGPDVCRPRRIDALPCPGERMVPKRAHPVLEAELNRSEIAGSTTRAPTRQARAAPHIIGRPSPAGPLTVLLHILRETTREGGPTALNCSEIS